MIDCYTWPTPNGHKVHIMLEECGLEWTVHPINIMEGDQFDPAFLKISPNNKMPAIVDADGPGGQEIAVFESGAILIYLADKTGRFLPTDPRPRYDALQWLMWQMGGIGPMLGQAHHFNNYAPQRFERAKLQYGIDRYVNEANRLYGVLDKRLDGRDWVAAGTYTIADMAIFPWLRFPENQGGGDRALSAGEGLARQGRRTAGGGQGGRDAGRTPPRRPWIFRQGVGVALRQDPGPAGRRSRRVGATGTAPHRNDRAPSYRPLPGWRAFLWRGVRAAKKPLADARQPGIGCGSSKHLRNKGRKHAVFATPDDVCAGFIPSRRARQCTEKNNRRRAVPATGSGRSGRVQG